MATKEKYNFRQKFNLALALLAVFFLILATNLVDRRHFETAQEALTSVYEDRVVAQHYIFEISTIVYQKEQQFIDAYLRVDEDNDYVLQSVPCTFLDADNYCMIYDVRPKACREFPHTDRKKFQQISNLTLKNVFNTSWPTPF